MAKAKQIKVKKSDPVYSIVIDGFRVEGTMKWCERMERNARLHATTKQISEIKEVKVR